MPTALRLSSRNFTAAEVGSLRRNACPSTRTVSYSPSGSFSAFGVRSASRLGSRDSHRSGGSRKCESPELVQIFGMDGLRSAGG